MFWVYTSFLSTLGLLAQNQAQCLITGNSGQRADEDHESEREEETADSEMQLVSDINLHS